VKPLDFPLLTDENIVPDVVQGLRVRGCDVRSASDEHLLGRPDAGHISAGFVLAVIDALQTSSVEVEAPFVAVAERQESTVRVRVRTAPPW
jgi:hypothetical protein